MIYVTAGHEFGFKGHTNRPFVSQEEAEDIMVTKWNAVVGRGDEVLYLGNFSRGPVRIKPIAAIAKRLKGNKVLVPGPYDRFSRETYAHMGFTMLEKQDVPNKRIYNSRFGPIRLYLNHLPPTTLPPFDEQTPWLWLHGSGLSFQPYVGTAHVGYHKYFPMSLDALIQRVIR